MLQCKLNAPYNGEPEWTKDGKDIPKGNGHFKTETTAFTKKLTLLNFERKDAGVYKCVCDTASTQATIRISGDSNYNIMIYNLVNITNTCIKKNNQILT